MKVISFSLYGTAQKYRVGMLRNLELAKQYYPDWRVRIYADAGCVTWICHEKEIGFYDNPTQFDLIACSPLHFAPPLMWRFLVADDPQVERFIVRDADSRIGAREAAAVAEWEKEDTILHVMRDHQAHCNPIMGGMWGLQPRRSNWEMPKMEGLIREFLSSDNPYLKHDYQVDQEFLWSKIWPMFKHTCTQHASVCRNAYPGSKPFPTKRDFPRFVGEVYEIDSEGREHPREGDWQQIKQEE